MLADTYSFVNGAVCSWVDSANRGLAYGHGVFETMRLVDGAVPLWQRHRCRLVEGLTRLGIALDETQLAQEFDFVLTQVPQDGVLKLIVTAGEGSRGYKPTVGGDTTRLFQWFPRTASPKGVCLQICNYPLPHNPRLAGIKHLNRLDQVLAAAEVADGNLGLVLDVEGWVIETISQNLFVYSKGRWLTPDLSRCGVAGVLRALLLEDLMPRSGQLVQVADLTLEHVMAADELMICNAVNGIQCVDAILGVREGLLHTETRKIQVALEEMLPCYTV